MLDENATGRFDYRVDRPVVDDGAILDVGWNADAGYTGFTCTTGRRTASTPALPQVWAATPTSRPTGC